VTDSTRPTVAQICISTDYVLTTPQTEPKLIDALKRALAAFSANPSSGSSEKSASTSLVHNPNYSRIINQNHYNRVSKLLDATKGEVVVGGGRDEKERKIEVTIVRGVKPDDSLMSGALRCSFPFQRRDADRSVRPQRRSLARSSRS
jgi:acyl-CoA reductase-like NAD-dependent aldehyde dehydrogenase